jgi:hypothetical protein
VAYSQDDTNAALLKAILQHHQQQQQPQQPQQQLQPPPQQPPQPLQQRQQQEGQPKLYTKEELQQYRKKAELQEIADELGVHYKQKDTLAVLRDAILQHQQQQQLLSQPQQQPEPVQATGLQQQEQQLQSQQQQQQQQQQQLSWGQQLLLQDQAVPHKEQLLQADAGHGPLGTPAAVLEAQFPPVPPEGAAEAAAGAAAAPSRRRTRRGSVHPAASTHSSSTEGTSSSGSSGPVVAVAQVAVDPASSSSFLGGSVDDSSNSSTSSFLSDASSSSISSSSIRRRSSTGRGSTASSGWTPPRPGGLAVSGVLGGGLEPPTVAELRSDPTAAGILAEFERFFCSEVPQKVWHNYGFDRHVLEGLLPRDAVSGQQKKLAGFGGDTLHMSRLHDASRKTKGGYGLEALSSDKEVSKPCLLVAAGRLL